VPEVPTKPPLLVFGPRSTTYDFGPAHPLTPRRFGPGISLLEALGAVPNLAPEPAADAELEWIHDSARWTYDESRHCRMGYERLIHWGFDPVEIPLGTYIYESASGEDPIYLLGMLYFFETKNIRHKLTRAQFFHEYGDLLSEHDMDFDWADETIHAGYGKHWLKELLAVRGEEPSVYEQIRERCGKLVSDYVGTATPEEIVAIKKIANALLVKAAHKS